MANPDAPFGLIPVRHLNGSPWNGATIRCHAPAAYTGSALFIGDPVMLETTNATRSTTTRCPTVELATGTTGTKIFGVITSFEPDPDNLSLKHRLISTNRYCNVCVAPDVVYWVRDNADSNMTKADIGSNCDLIMGSGNAITGLSGVELDSDTQAETASLTTLIMGVADVEDNEFDGSTDNHIIWEVIINMHQLRATGDATGALGVSGD
jgi:hypothetical protein